MAARFVDVDYDTPLILPPNLRDWVPAGHLAHFILDAVEELDLQQVRVNERGTGHAQYPPRMLLALLLYGYATGTFSSRRLGQASFDSVPVRLICGDTHPDHDTLCTFRRANQALLQEACVRVLELAQALKFLRVGQLTVAVDGTKVLANASKHGAVSYAHAGKTITQLEGEVKELLAKAEQADSTALKDGLTIPEEIQRRQERKAKLAAARAEIEARAAARAAAEMSAYQARLAARAAQKEAGQKPRGQEPKAPSPEPRPGDQYNFRENASRLYHWTVVREPVGAQTQGGSPGHGGGGLGVAGLPQSHRAKLATGACRAGSCPAAAQSVAKSGVSWGDAPQQRGQVVKTSRRCGVFQKSAHRPINNASVRRQRSLG